MEETVESVNRANANCASKTSDTGTGDHEDMEVQSSIESVPDVKEEPVTHETDNPSETDITSVSLHSYCTTDINRPVIVMSSKESVKANGRLDEESKSKPNLVPNSTKAPVTVTDDTINKSTIVEKSMTRQTECTVKSKTGLTAMSDSEEDSEEKDITEEEAHAILMKALKKIGPKMGKEFVLMFKDPSTSEVKEIASDKGKQFLEDNSDVLKKFSNVCSDDNSKNRHEKDTEVDETEAASENDDTTNSVKSTSNSELEVIQKTSRKKTEVKPLKRAPRTSVILKKLAKLDEKERLKNSQIYCCEHCPSKFGTTGNLNKHLKNKHNLDSTGKTICPKQRNENDSSSDVTEYCENLELQPTKEKQNEVQPLPGKIKIENCGDFETIVTESTEVDPPTTAEKKKGRGRPPKNKSLTDTKVVDNNNSRKPVGRPRKNNAEEEKKSPKNDNKSTKSTKIKYTDDDLKCFINTVEEEDTKMNLECKLCLLRFSIQRRAWDHVLQEHRQNVEQCTRTLDVCPDTSKTSRFDSYIYTIQDDTKEGIIPAELFNTPGRAGRRRTPSKKLLESQNALIQTTYVCKICHRKASNKSSILQHMTKYHSDVLPDITDEKEDNDEEEEEEVEEEEDEEEEFQDDNEDQDYKPSHEPDIDEEVTKTPTKATKRKQNDHLETQRAKRKKKDEQESDTLEDKKINDTTNEQNENILADDDKEVVKGIVEDVLKHEDATPSDETGDTDNNKTRRIRNRPKTYKKAPSYYVYCDHDETVMDRRSTQSLPFCKTCDRFKCLQCTLTFKKSSHYNRHIRIIHNKEKRYKCTKCEARFTTNESLQYHKKWHTGVKDVECPHCDMKFLVMKNLRKHMNKHHPGLAPIRKKKANHCEICDSQFSRKERLEYHMLEKHPANNPDKECRICGQKFETEEECFRHSDAHADMAKVPVAKCPHCDVYCSSKNNLKRHVDRVHLNIKKYLCNECGKRFKGRDAFLYHVKRHADPDGRDFECHICNKKIATEKGLEIHLRTHTGLKPYVCETCGKGFAQKGNMLSHQAIHLDARPFECEECHKTFKKKFDLYKHMKRHKIKHVHQTGDLSHLEGAGKIYECPLEDCKELFCSTNDLRLHIRKHNNEKPFECMICFKTFAVKSRLIRHLRNVHHLHVPESDLESIKGEEWVGKMEAARRQYEEKKQRYQTVMIPQPSGEQIEVQIFTEESSHHDHEGVEDLLALSTPQTFNTEKVEHQTQEIEFKIETSEEGESSNVQIINVSEDGSGEVHVHTDQDNIVLDPAIIQTLLNSGQQTIYYYVDQ